MNTEDLKKYLSKEYQGSQSFLENIIYPIFGEEEFVDGYETETKIQLQNATRSAKVRKKSEPVP
jgi:hypothetical protein